MAKLTQGTTLYWIDGTTVQAVAATNISGISAQRDSIETTDLTNTAKTFMPGLMSPGSAQFTIQFDPSNTVHTKLHAAYVAGTNLKFALGWSDGTAAPTITTGNFTLPTTRTFMSFEGFLQDVTFDFSLNTVVSSQVSVQVSGMPTLSAKV
jgi:hypothetical protein